MPAKIRSKASPKSPGILPSILIIVGILLLIGVIFLVKNQPSQTSATANESPEAKLDRLMEEGKPVFVFFHSTNCQSCIDMMNIVDQVYPEYQSDVALVDVNVYDPQNQNLLRRAGINTIPTQVFIRRNGDGKVTLGLMEPNLLRQQLNELKGTP